MKEAIMKVASEKIEKYGLRKFTMDEIASDLKVSKKTLYKYFKSKDDIINQYFEEIVETDRNSTIEAISHAASLEEKLDSIIYSYHKYRLPINVIDEAYKFYNEQWLKIQELKDFKLSLIESILKEGIEEGILKKDIQLNIITLMLEQVSNTFLNHTFLDENNMTMKEALGKVMSILLYGILK